VDLYRAPMAVFRSTFPISASAAVVWSILVDFERWSEWNPSVPRLRGDAALGSTLSMTLAMPGRPSARAKAKVTDLVPERRLSWHGNIGGAWFFSGTREFDIAPQPDGTVLVTHVEDVKGLLFPVFRAVMGSAIREHHDNLNAALTQRAEAANS
jgi:hypothetical protein